MSAGQKPMARDKPEDRELKRIPWAPNLLENKYNIPSLTCFIIYSSHQPIATNEVVLTLIPKLQGSSPSCACRTSASSSQALWAISGSHEAGGGSHTGKDKFTQVGLIWPPCQGAWPATAPGAGNTLGKQLGYFLLPSPPPRGGMPCCVLWQNMCRISGENDSISKPVSTLSCEYNSSYFSP